jgi:U3 small nucleolar RNA-associated protein 12
LFLEEERERELEHIYESGIADAFNRPEAANESENPAEATAVTKQTTETLMAGEKIMEALDMADAEHAALRKYEEDKGLMAPADAAKLQPPPRNPVLTAYGLEPEAYVLRVVERVQSTALHDALLVLPFDKVVSLMGYLNIWAQKVGLHLSFPCWVPDSACLQEWNITLVSRIIFFLLKTHHHQIVANRIMRTALIPLRKHLRAALQRQKETIGYNLAALRYIHRRNEADRTAEFHEEQLDETIRARIAEGKKRKRVQIYA